MKFFSAISAALLWVLPGGPLHGQETISEADKALFDELLVTGDAEKAARERMKKSEETPQQAQPGLPANAEKLLERLAVYEASLYSVTDEAIALSRKKLGGELIKLSGASTEPAKTELVATAKNIEGLRPGVELPSVMPESDFPGEWLFPGGSRWYYRDGRIKTDNSTGTWRWLNDGNQVVVADYSNSEYVDVLRLVIKPGKPAFVEGVNQKGEHWTLTRGKPDPGKPGLPAEANKLIAAARSYESQARTKSLKQAQEKRERVAAWMVEKAKTDADGAAKLLLQSANRLREAAAEPAKGGLRGNFDAFSGKIYRDPKRRTWEFLPNGTVKSNGLTWGMWEWAKSSDDPWIIICSGSSGKAENPMLVRPSNSSPGKLHFFGFDDKFEADLKP